MEAEIKEAFQYLADHAGGLTIGEIEFVKGLRKWYNETGSLSEKQERSLLEIRKYRQRRDSHLY